MKLSALSAVALAAAAAAAQDFEASSVHTAKMTKLMAAKDQSRNGRIAAGLYDEGRYTSQAVSTKCVNGFAGEYECNNVDLLNFMTHADMGSKTREGNDIWGWTSSTGREFALVGQTDGTAFVEVMSDGRLVYVGRLPTQTASSIWRDIKVIGDYAYIGSEASRHGLQVFDLTKLLSIKSGQNKTFSITSDLTAQHSGFSNSHNIVANPETNMIYAVGSNQCRGGLYMLDVSAPSSPVYKGCVSDDGYVHDAQCLVYPSTGVDAAFAGHEICFNFNEDTLTIVDVTDKSRPQTLSRTGYKTAAYTHQGWVADPVSMKYILLDDELDEYDNTLGGNRHTNTYIFDISDLSSPKYTGNYKSPVNSIDHNQYVIDGLAYQSNYNSGLRIVDVSSVTRDPTGASMREVGFFDVAPDDSDSSTSVDFGGSWSVYPYFESGVLIVNSIERGLFALKYTGGGATS